MDTLLIPKIASKYLGMDFPESIKCVSFFKLVYGEINLPYDFSLQPKIIEVASGCCDEMYIGKVIFLMNRKKISYLFNHIAIVYDKSSVIHYSIHASPNERRQVCISSFENLLTVYEIVENPYVGKPLIKSTVI